MKRGSILGGTLMVAFLAACDGSPTALEGSVATDELAALVAEASAVEDAAEAVRSGAPHVPNLRFLLHQALKKVADEEGTEVARSILSELRQKQLEIRRKAIAAGTPQARRRAAAAIELETAKVVVRILGPEVVERVMGIAAERIAALEARIEAAPDTADTARAERLLALLKEELAKAEAALEANPAQALVHALRAAQGVHRLHPHPRPGTAEPA